MNHILNITNGDSAVKIMQKAIIPGEFLAWQDVLHDGPVPGDISLEALSKIRAEFIAQCGWGERSDIENLFTQRDDILKSSHQYEKIILWFEHDLYDQLQILQILDWFNLNTNPNIALSLICTDQYLGMLSPTQMKEMVKFEKIISAQQLTLASNAWSAFRHSSPEKWQDLLSQDTSSLPFLKSAIIRLLEQYPEAHNGLSRTAQSTLEIISSDENKPGKIFGLYQETEDAKFMGDATFWIILQKLLDSTPPLLKIANGKTLTLPTNPSQSLSITPAGVAVMKAKQNWLDTNTIDRWIGGVHLTNNNIWCWNSRSQCMEKKQ